MQTRCARSRYAREFPELSFGAEDELYTLRGGVLTDLFERTLFSASTDEARPNLNGVLFTDRIEQVVPPGKGRSHAMRIMHELMNFQPVGIQTDLTSVLGRFGQMAKKHSVAFLVSDFLTDACILEMQALAVKHDVNAIHVVEPAVETGGASGLIRMKDSESGEQRVIQIRKRDTASVAHGEQLQHVMMESGINLLNVGPGDDCVEALAGFFHARQRQEIDETGG